MRYISTPTGYHQMFVAHKPDIGARREIGVFDGHPHRTAANRAVYANIACRSHAQIPEMESNNCKASKFEGAASAPR